MHNQFSSAAPTLPLDRFEHSTGRSALYSVTQERPAGLCERDIPYQAPRLIDSVVAEAGLGRFVYLLGRSGKRYVFSSITIEQAALYDRAVFACSRAGSDRVSISPCAKEASRAGHMLYVHLLDDDEPQVVIEDLNLAMV